MVLERLEQQGVFLSPVTWERREYRFHQLFADYLSERLERSDLAQFSALQRRAAQGFAARGMDADAGKHDILRSEERRDGKADGSTGSARWMSASYRKNSHTKQHNLEI